MARRLLILAALVFAPAAWVAVGAEPEQGLFPAAETHDAGASVPAVGAVADQAAIPEPLDRSVALAPAVPPVRPKGPQVRHTDRRFDWGEVPANQSFGHVFTLHNVGDAVLHIQKLRPS